MAGPIAISILANERGAVAGIDRVSERGRRMGASLAKAGKVAAIGLGVVSVAAVGAAAKLAMAAAEDQQSANRMAQTFTKAAGATRQQVAATEEWITKQGLAKGVADDQLRPALAQLVTATKDVGQAQKLASLAMDVSAARGISLEAASKAIAKAQNGQVAGLSRLGISTKDAAGKTIDMETATKRLGDAYGGAATSNANTLMGRIERLKLIFAEAGESIGYKLLPPLLDFSEWAIAKGVPAVSRIASTLSGSLAPPLKAIGGFAADVAGKVRDLADGFDVGAAVIAPVVAALQTYATTAQTVVLPAVVAVASYLAARLLPIFAQVAQIITGQVIPTVTGLAGFLYGTLVPAVVAIAGKIATNLKPVFDALVGVLQARILPTLSTLLAKFEAARPTIQRVIVVVVKVVGAVLTFAAAILGKVLPPLIRFSGFLNGTVVAVLVRVVSATVKVIGAVIRFGGAVIDGAKKVAEFARSVGERVGRVVGFFTGLPGKITGALAGAGTMLLQTGIDIIAGLLQGIREKAGELASTIQSYVIDKIPGPVRKALGIKSPSRVMKLIGKQIMDGLIVGVSGASDRLSTALGKAATLVDRTFDDRLTAVEKRLRKRLKGAQLDKALRNAERANTAARKAATKGLRDEEKALQDNARAQDRLTAKLEAARAKLAELRQQAADFATSIREAFLSYGSITSLGEGAGYADANGLVANLEARVQQATQFAAIIQQLIAAGLNQTTIQQLLAAGVEGGMGAAQTLLSGGSAIIGQVNTLTGQLAAAGQGLGNTAAQTMYGAGISATEGLVAGLESQGKALERIAKKLARMLVRAVKDALGIKSPSRVFRGMALDSVRGLDIGFDNSYVRRIGTRAATALQRGFGTPALDAYANATGSAASGGQVIEIRLTAEQTSDLQMGKTLMSKIDVARGAGVKWAGT